MSLASALRRSLTDAIQPGSLVRQRALVGLLGIGMACCVVAMRPQPGDAAPAGLTPTAQHAALDLGVAGAPRTP